MTVNVNFKGGGSIIGRKPVFSSDGENVFVAWKNSILEYSTKTGRLVHEFKGLKERVAGFSFSEYDGYQCIIACSVTGKVMFWKAVTHFVIHEKKLSHGDIQNFQVIKTPNQSELSALISYKKESKIHFTLLNLTTFEEEHASLKITGSYNMAVGGCNYFCITQDNVLYTIYFKNLKRAHRTLIQNPRKFTCLACHPLEEAVLTGDNHGRVIAWRNLSTNKPAQAVYHWHTLPVKSVAFSTSGSYFYSGGDESVLVKWRLDNSSEKSFVPRIAASIRQIQVSHNNMFIGVATDDNAVRIFDSRMNQISLIQHLVIGKQLTTGIIYDTRTKALVMNGNIGHIQFYSPLDGSLLYNLDIVGQNKITNERNCTIENTEVCKIAVSKCGLWLATVEDRPDDELLQEIRLKFWKFDETQQTFELNTSIEYPHEKTITNILFQPTANVNELKCATVSQDRKFKVWQLTDVKSVYKSGFAWQCYSIGYYKDLPCQGLSFSIDGSLLGTGFGPILTTWVPETSEMKCSLVHPNYKLDIKFVEFGKGNDCHLIVTASKSYLNVWNLLSLNLVWTVSIDVSLLIADSLTTHMAVISKNRKVIVFTPGSSQPVYTSKKLKKSQDIVAAAFLPSRYSNDARLNWSERSALYFIDSHKELFCLSQEDEVTDYVNGVEDNVKSLFGKMQASKQISNVSSVAPTRHLYEQDNGHKDIKSFLDTPAHTMIPIRFMCRHLLSTLVLQKDPQMNAI